MHDLLGPGFECIDEQRPGRPIAPSERIVVIRQTSDYAIQVRAAPAACVSGRLVMALLGSSACRKRRLLTGPKRTQ
jgi:hypothetical protein